MAINKSEIKDILGTKIEKWIKVECAKNKPYHREIETARAINRIINAIRREPKYLRNELLDAANKILKSYSKHHEKWLINLEKIDEQTITTIVNCINDWIKWIDKSHVSHAEELESLERSKLADQQESKMVFVYPNQTITEENEVSEAIEEIIEEVVAEVAEEVAEEIVEEIIESENDLKAKKPIPKKIIVRDDFTEIFTETVSGIQSGKTDK